MKKLLTILFCVLIVSITNAQEQPPKWNINLSIGQYPAALTPSFTPLHLGIKAGATYQWNNHQKHRWLQSLDLNYFKHRYLQHAIQLYSETSYQLHFKNGLQLHPFSIGGGYVMSISDMNSVIWNETTQQYEALPFFIRNNWMISLGTGLGYQSKLSIMERPISFHLAYRIQIQGIMMQNNVPVIVYSPIMFGLSLPISKPSTNN